MPGVTIQKTYTEEKKAIRAVVKKAKTILYSLGMDEIVTYTLTSRFSIETLGISFDNVVRLQNPLSSNQEFMRPSLSSEMLEVLSWNMNRKNPLLGLFELSKVYFNDKKNSGVQEKLHLSLGMAGVLDGNWKDRSREIDFFDLKGLVAQFLDFLGIKDYSIEKEESVIFKDALSATLKVGGQVMGILGEVKPDLAKKFDIKQKVYLAEIYFEDLLKHIDLKTRFMPLPRYPSVKRDISILVDDSVTASGILDVIKKEGGSLIKAVKLFDLYKGHQIEQDKKSLGFTMEYRSDEKTLKEEDIAQIHKRIQDAMVKKIGAQIR
jgi:phenylalanyl-tRNA synthetase beta chain